MKVVKVLQFLMAADIPLGKNGNDERQSFPEYINASESNGS